MSNARAERARGRADRAAARQAGRQERRTAGHSAGVADRSRGRDQARANRQQEWQDRRAKRAEREAAQQAKRGAATPAATGRTTLGGALGEEAQRRWDERRGKAAKRADAGKVDLTKNKKGKPEAADRAAAKEAPDGASSAGRGTPAGGEPGKGDKAADGVSGAAKKRRRSRRRTASSGRTRRRGRTRRTDRAGRAGGTGRRGRAGRSSDGRFGPEPAPTVEWPDHPARPPRTAGKGVDDDVVDADIVPDAPAAMTTGAKGLPPAPEQHTQRPGTSRPTAQEDPVAAQVSKPPAGQTGMAARHRTDITFGEYLTAIVNIAIAAGADAERAQDLAAALGRVADALRDMAADLVGDHNIATEVIDRITDLADAADRMKALAERCATECEIASEAALLAAKSVGRVYGEDMQAMDDAGLARASSAAHHD
ncbi:ATP/GTP-binding protein [Streptomyces sp. NPDC047803]|uniref:ATP/GTP-binding protein n=1 Tax=Streptomyces TaxID=1883 RepID=UPI00340ABDB6